MMPFYNETLVLVTGGAGFIGSHVVEHLVQNKAKVRVLDNLSTGKSENLAHLMDKIEFINGDICDYETCIAATKGVAFVFHLAAEISVPYSVENPHHCFTTNVMGTVNILEAARHNNCKRVIFSSSSSVYGQQDGIFIEDRTPTKPQSPYALSKLQGEQLMEHYYRLYGLQTVSMRYFNVYGERQDPNSRYAAAVAKFKENMRLNKPITFYGDGYQTRDFVHVSEVAETNLNLGMFDEKLVCGKVFNVATGKSINLFQLYDQIKKEFPDYSGHIEFAPERPGDVKHTSADCSKYKSILKLGQK